MLTMLRDLILHKGYANAALLMAIQGHPTAAEDRELREKLHHIIVANRFWLALILNLEFDVEKEKQIPESLDGILDLYRETHRREVEWIDQLQESDLERRVESAFLPGADFSESQAMMQVCMHSNGHRVQCASRLRALGGTPPSMDFIVWLKARRPGDWS